MTFYNLIAQLSTMHIRFKKGGYSDGLDFNQDEKNISVKDIYLMKNGKVVPQILKLDYGIEFEITEDMELIYDVDNPYEELERLYGEYKNSVPNEYSKYLKNNFICKQSNDLRMFEFIVGKSRQQARAELEAFVMLTNFEWEDETKYYWQSNKDKDLILSRNWR